MQPCCGNSKHGAWTHSSRHGLHACDSGPSPPKAHLPRCIGLLVPVSSALLLHRASVATGALHVNVPKLRAPLELHEHHSLKIYSAKFRRINAGASLVLPVTRGWSPELRSPQLLSSPVLTR